MKQYDRNDPKLAKAVARADRVVLVAILVVLALVIFAPYVVADPVVVKLKLRLPETRTDGTPLSADEIATVCAVASVIDTGDRASAKSEKKCWPIAELEIQPPPSPPQFWTVADNWWSDTRPVYDAARWLEAREQIGRAPEGDFCGELVEDSTGGKTWREYTMPDGAQGVVLCSLPDSP